MFRCDENFTQPKRYIQFNDLVFLGRKSIDEQTESISLREIKPHALLLMGLMLVTLVRCLLWTLTQSHYR